MDATLGPGTLRAKGDLGGSFQGLAYRYARMVEGLRKLDMGSSGGLRQHYFSLSPTEGASSQHGYQFGKAQARPLV